MAAETVTGRWLPGAGIGNNVALVDADGAVRIGVGPKGRGNLPSRIGTIGRQRGVLIFRYTASSKIILRTSKGQ